MAMLDMGHLVAEHGGQLVIGQGGDEAVGHDHLPRATGGAEGDELLAGQDDQPMAAEPALPTDLLRHPGHTVSPPDAQRRATGQQRDNQSGNRRGDAHRSAARCDVLAHLGDVLQAGHPEQGWGGLDGQACFDDDGAGREQPGAGPGPLGRREPASQGPCAGREPKQAHPAEQEQQRHGDR
jgi:hypothetical protein